MKITATRSEARITKEGRVVFTIVSFDDGDTRAYWEGHVDPALLQGAFVLELNFANLYDFETFMDPEELDWDEIEDAKQTDEVEGDEYHRLVMGKKLCELVREAATYPADVDREAVKQLNEALNAEMLTPENMRVFGGFGFGRTLEELDEISKAVNE